MERETTMIVYIAGKITGREDSYKQIFKEAQDKLERQGHIVINPSFLPVGLEFNKYMPICLSMLEAADAIYLLDGWDNSKGALIEKMYADYQRKVVIMEVKGDAEGETKKIH